MDDFHIVIRQNGNFFDVTNRKMVLWAAGNYARYMCAELQLSDIAIVIDSNPDLRGAKIVLYGKEYVISVPDILKELAVEEYFIVIGSMNFKEEITAQIYNEYGYGVLICSKREDFFRSYFNIRTMLLIDPVMHKKICVGNVSILLMEYIEKLDIILRNHLKADRDKFYYLPMREGFRVSFIVMDENLQGKYIVHFPTRLYREEYTPSDEKYIEEAYHCKEKLGLKQLIDIYEDKEGFEVEIYAENNIAWNDEILNSAMASIRKVHNSRIEINVNRDPWNRLYHREVFLYKSKSYLPEEIRKKIHSVIKPEVCRYERKLCHGDFHQGNIVLYEKQLVIIDWEWIGMSDPMLDICHFINSYRDSSGNLLCTFDKVLTLYLQRPPFEKEIQHAKAVLIMDLYMSYCVQLIRTNSVNEKAEQKINKLLYEYECMS